MKTKIVKKTKGKKGKVIKTKGNSGGFLFTAPGAVIIDERICVRGVDRKDPKFKELVESIKHFGTLIQPIVLFEGKKGLTLVDGRQRIEASIIAKLKSIPYVLTEGNRDHLMSMGLDANEARVAMTIMQEAAVIARMKKILTKKSKGKKVSNVKLAKALNRDERWIADHLNLLSLPKEVQSALDENNAGEVTIGKTHELMRVHEKDRVQLIPEMKRMSLNPFRSIIEKKAKDGVIRFVGGKAKPRTERGKKAKSKGAAKAEKLSYTKTIKTSATKAEAQIDVMMPTPIQALLAKTEKAFLGESKKKSPDAAEVAYQRGKIHAFLLVLNLPEANSLKDSLQSFEAKALKAAAKEKAAKKKEKKAKKGK